ncbi:hypothetical protein [Salinisphaera hydrothermalis]|uniref:hypothetical protein n=1 Tax=Salinisphaera hydrothermalis TaxID=563188 RepID=UPI00333E3691
MSKRINDGLFELCSAHDLFKKCQYELALFEHESNHYNLFNLLVTLSHLRDWIWPLGHTRYDEATPESKAAADFHRFLHNDLDYCVVRDLSNSAKHFSSGLEMKVVKGARVGLMRCGDSLGQSYYLIANDDVRNSAYSVMRMYVEFFRSQGYET